MPELWSDTNNSIQTRPTLTRRPARPPQLRVIQGGRNGLVADTRPRVAMMARTSDTFLASDRTS